MIKKSAGKKLLIGTIFIDAALILLILFFMNYVQFLINQDASINLSEIVTQNKDVITSKLLLEVNNVELDAKQLSERFLVKEASTNEARTDIFFDYMSGDGRSQLLWIDKDGKAVNTEKKEIVISSRHYFRLAMQGISNISERVVSKFNGDDVFIICAPVKYNGEIVGAVSRQYTVEQMYDICSVSLFSEKGTTYIINKQGYVLISPKDQNLAATTESYYRMLYTSNPEASKQIESDLANDKSGFMEINIDDKKFFSAYTPIEQVYDWYLITSVETSAVSPNSQVAIITFYCILGGVVLLFTFSMIYYVALRRRKEAELEKIAFFDSTTGGITYAKFDVEMRKIINSNPENQFHICALDVDSFKYINGFYGLEQGDWVLKELYWRLSERLVENELVARIHSDHFIMLLSDTNENRLNEIVESEQCFGDITIYISAGLYHIQNRKEDLKLMNDKAVIASQSVKGNNHKGVAVYTDDFDKELASNEQIKRAIENALRDDEIVPFYQPKVNPDTRQIVGAEALARWIKKDGEMVSPAHFIPVCEKSGLITSLDMVIFEKTLDFLRKQIEAGIKCVPISVNFSKLHLSSSVFLELLLLKIEKYQVPPSLIELELTESVIFDNSDRINEFISKVHSCGMKISMDDFGSGYSSLHMLKDVDIDVLKIDRGFLLQTIDSEKQTIVFGTIIEMARKLNMEVVVEGVETEENLALVNKFGCSIIQGYYFSKPINEKAFLNIFTDNNGKI